MKIGGILFSRFTLFWIALRFCSEEVKEFLQNNSSRIEETLIEKHIIESNKKKKTTVIAAVAACVLLVLGIVVYTAIIIPNGKYNEAVEAMNSGDYENAI